jgi:hypothetical protein
MAEKVVSPGVFTNEIDQSFLPAGVSAIGAAVVGPTTRGPANIPTVISTYSQYQRIFGGVFTSGSGASENSYKYLTDYAAREYLKFADTLTVVRILATGHSPASTVVSSSTTNGATFASASLGFTHNPTGSMGGAADEITIGGIDFTFVSESAGLSDTANQVFVEFGHASATAATNLATTVANLKTAIEAQTLALTVTANGDNGLIFSGSGAGTSGNITITTGSGGDTTATTLGFVSASDSADAAVGSLNVQGGTDNIISAVAFELETLHDGEDQNSIGPITTNGLLRSGSRNNVRWEVSNVNNAKGTFTLLIRRGDDTNNRKTILEQYNNVTLDPNEPNFISRIVGDQTNTLRDGGSADPFLQLTGSYANRSNFVRVKSTKLTLNYLDENGNVRDGSLSGSLPVAGSGSFSGGSDGNKVHPKKYYEEIEDANTQGFNLNNDNDGKNAYIDAIRLLKNQDEYDINLITLPGLVNGFTAHAQVLTEALNMVEDRGDCFLIVDPVGYGTALNSVTSQAESRDSNYAAMYWPWIKIPDADLGRNTWVPASTVIPSVYAFNDRVAAPWFAPAGLNRGGIDIAVQTERKLTHANRDDLYDSGINPIATFPNAGVTVFGQKTLQKKASALDRVNVRRLLIAAKKFIASTTRFLVFENNTTATRNRFLSIVNPYFESVQQRQGLFAFRVVMDETNNTPDVVDRNEMRGQIFLQPAKTAEFIIIDFNVLPTGAAFPE